MKIFQPKRCIALLIPFLIAQEGACQTARQGSQAFDAQTANRLVDQVSELVAVCQSKAQMKDSLDQLLFQTAYEAELARVRLERPSSGLVTGTDRMMAQEVAAKQVQDTYKDGNPVSECKKMAKTGMDQGAKKLVAEFSHVGLGNQAKSFVSSWYATLQSVGTERYKEHLIRMQSNAETLKLESTMRGAK